MKKKVWTIVAAAGILFTGAGTYSILADSPGYESYKVAVKKTHTLDNATTELQMSITDNGKLLLDTNTIMKFDKKQDSAEGAVKIKTLDQELQLNAIVQDGQPIIQRTGEETYYLTEEKHPKMNTSDGKKFHDPAMMKLGELVMNAVTQPIQDDFKVDKNTIIIEMNNEDIPAIIHSIGQQVIKMGFKAHSEIELSTAEYPFLAENFVSKLPMLERDITIEKVFVQANLTDEGYLKNQDAAFTVRGKDQSGIAHEVEINVSIAVTNVNKTQIDKINLEGKVVERFEMKKVH
ncbi:hypothetical protein [Mesobacillus harenae]|uniref:hypothetical protein n=1 Tax=Mesobacillus harenae TaxID=2213203 RepID=UPI001581308F|nr:hypothetical protein [Mesobacillus harenae]